MSRDRINAVTFGVSLSDEFCKNAAEILIFKLVDLTAGIDDICKVFMQNHEF